MSEHKFLKSVATAGFLGYTLFWCMFTLPAVLKLLNIANIQLFTCLIGGPLLVATVYLLFSNENKGREKSSKVAVETYSNIKEAVQAYREQKDDDETVKLVFG